MVKVEKFTAIWAACSFVVGLIFTKWSTVIVAPWLQIVIGVLGFVFLVSMIIALSVYAERVYQRIKYDND